MFGWKKKKNKTDEELLREAEEAAAAAAAESEEESLPDSDAEMEAALQDEVTEEAAESGESGEKAAAEEFVEESASEETEEAVPEETLTVEAQEEEEEAEPEDTAENASSESEGEEERPVEEAEADIAEETEEPLPAVEEDEPQKKKGFFRRLVEGLSKTRANIARGFSSVFSGSAIDEDFYEELEEILITADMGVETTENVLDDLRDKVDELRLREPAQCREILMESIREQMKTPEGAFDFENRTSVILVIGVNGVGKTTSIGKLAAMMKGNGKRVLLAAADTFRAAAAEQLKEWANRAGVEIIAGQEGADPGSIVYDAISAAKARHADVLICDTAGRLHNKKNLMDELGKIYRIIGKEFPEAHLETFVVVDGTTGQNALIQAKQFGEVADVTGIILTKLDGTAKGGIAVAIESQLDIPVKYIGVGEKIDDLQKFDADSFVNALFEA